MSHWSFLPRSFVVAVVAAAMLPFCTHAFAQDKSQDKSIVVASTTSTQDSGLFGYLLPIVKEKTGIDVKVLAQGTGQALDTARRGDADVVFVHAKSAEEKFLAEGFGVKRYPVMYNDFVLIGPQRRSGRDQGQGHSDRAANDQGQGRAVHLARRPLRHQYRRARALEGRRHRHRK